VIPVLLGLLWFPFLRQVHARWVDFFLALTMGLLGFIGIEALVEAVETSALVPGAFQGTGLVVIGVFAAPLLLAALGNWRSATRGSRPGYHVALLIAIGIGLHNFGEGLAIGAAFALGEAALGTLLIVGFTLHNTTEGLAILAPIAKERPSIGLLIKLGLIGGVPTIAGAWLGGFVYSRVAAVLCLGLGAGAIAQVIHQMSRQVGTAAMEHGAGPSTAGARFATAPIMLGLLAGFAVMYATGMLVG
jgi:ZIP family zinc transporter